MRHQHTYTRCAHLAPSYGIIRYFWRSTIRCFVGTTVTCACVRNAVSVLLTRPIRRPSAMRITRRTRGNENKPNSNHALSTVDIIDTHRRCGDAVGALVSKYVSARRSDALWLAYVIVVVVVVCTRTPRYVTIITFNVSVAGEPSFEQLLVRLRMDHSIFHFTTYSKHSIRFSCIQFVF